jgi:LAO/AO transport system kinase
LLNGQRWALAQAITLVESTNAVRQHQGQLLLSELQLINKQRHAQRQTPTMRIGTTVCIRRLQLEAKFPHDTYMPTLQHPIHTAGISGSPGVGKSTFIEAYGQHLLDEGLKLAVLVATQRPPLLAPPSHVVS